jgi:hypothetical protein
MIRMLVFMFPWFPWDNHLPYYVLMELSRFAIWEKSKVIMAISAVIWVINLGFQLEGKLISSDPSES